MSKRKTRDEDADEASDVIFTAELSAKRIAKVYKFKGMVLVDIREMWTDAAGDPKPSKKGVFASSRSQHRQRDVEVRHNDMRREEL